MKTVGDYVLELQRQGRFVFETSEAADDLGKSRTVAARALARLKAKGMLASPLRGFFVVIPPEYHVLGCLPAEQFVPSLMERLGESYYTALLSAAQIHGAAHQRPQVFQVMVRNARPPIECGRVRVEFHVRHDLERAKTVEIRTPRGFLRVASPETTALELIGYEKHAGGLGTVAGVLAELAETLDPEVLVDQARRVPMAWVQRLGYLLELVEERQVVDQLRELVRFGARRVVPLDGGRSRTGAPRSVPWKVAINTKIEVDL